MSETQKKLRQEQRKTAKLERELAAARAAIDNLVSQLESNWRANR